MNISSWISLASSIGAMSAALIALFTLRELSRQRKSSYKPDLCIIQNSFHLRGLELLDQEMCLALDWVTQDSAEVQEESLSRPSIRLVNIGLGAAKKVKAAWHFNYEKVLLEINQMAQRNCLPFFIERDELFLALKSKEAVLYVVGMQLFSSDFEYLLPSSIDSVGRELYFPPSYRLLVSVYLSLCVIETRSFENIKVPELELKLRYTDIGQSKHKSRHKLACEIIQITKFKAGNRCPEFEIRYADIS